MLAPILEVKELSVVYDTPQGAVLALDDVNLAVSPGEIVGLIGETGCGKSTLANAVLGILPRNQPGVVCGSIMLDGIDMVAEAADAQSARGRKITFVPQDVFGSLNPLFRVGTQITDLMRHSSPTRGRHRLWQRMRTYESEILSMFDAVRLPSGRKVLRQYPHQLSGGQCQRLMLAMALLPNPQLIIADEPTSALDASTQVEVLKLFRTSSRQRNVSIILMTHNLAAAWEVCDRVLVMHNGRIIESASRDSFFERPQHPYTFDLLASISEPLSNQANIRERVSENAETGEQCLFSRRCVRSTSLCRLKRPRLDVQITGHSVACHNPVSNPTHS